MKARGMLTVAMVGAAMAVASAFAPAAQARDVSVKDYQREMRLLLPVIESWNHDLNVNLTAMQTKPELACGDDYPQLVALGRSLAADMAGTALNAPATLRDQNLAAAAGLQAAVSGAGQASQDCDGANLGEVRTQVEVGLARYDENIARVRVFVTGLTLR
jgi:hypothetical protein